MAKKTKSKSLVVDTSALGMRDAFEIIDGFEKVILLTEVLLEMDRKKKELKMVGKDKEKFSYNIRQLLRASAKDYKGTQYQVIDVEKVSDYTDTTIMQFCKEHSQEVILFTKDYTMCNLCKGYHIEYILAEEEDSYEDTDITYSINTLQNSEMQGDKLILRLPKSDRIRHIVLDNEDKVKFPKLGNDFIPLEQGDTVLVASYNTQKYDKGLCITEFKVVQIQETDNVVFHAAPQLKILYISLKEVLCTSPFFFIIYFQNALYPLYAL